MPETTVSPDLLQPLQIFSQLVVQTVGKDLNQDKVTEFLEICLRQAYSLKYAGINAELNHLLRVEAQFHIHETTVCFVLCNIHGYGFTYSQTD